jgi:hypothetical protein
MVAPVKKCAASAWQKKKAAVSAWQKKKAAVK